MSEQKNDKGSKSFDMEQETLLSTIAEKAKDAECGRMSGLLTLARLTAEYVGNALGHAAEGLLAKSYTAAVKTVEVKLAEVTDDANYGVSRLLGLSGLATLVDDHKVMSAILPSQAKQLVRLVQRDADAAEVSFQWKEKALSKGKALVTECSTGKVSVVALVKRVDRVLDKKAAEDVSAAESAAKRLAAALGIFRKDGAGGRDDMLSKLVQTDKLGAKDIFAMLKALAANQKLKALAALGEACNKLAKRAVGAADDTAEKPAGRKENSKTAA